MEYDNTSPERDPSLQLLGTIETVLQEGGYLQEIAFDEKDRTEGRTLEDTQVLHDRKQHKGRDIVQRTA